MTGHRGRNSYERHGFWVRHKHSGEYGRISYFDRKTRLFWVVWITGKTVTAGGYHASQLALQPISSWPPDPWIEWEKIGKRKSRSELRAEIPSSNMTQTQQGAAKGEVREMARRSEVDELDLDDLDEAEEEAEAPKRKAKSKKGATPKKAEKPKGVGARQVAERLKVEPKTFRAWLRRQVAAGNVSLPGREGDKERYNFGADWNAPLVQKIIKLYESTTHEAGENLKKAQAAAKAKREAGGAKKATAKKATAKKKSSK